MADKTKFLLDEFTIEALKDFEDKLELSEDIHPKVWKNFFNGVSNYVDENQIFRIKNYKILEKISDILRFIRRNSDLLPKGIEKDSSIELIKNLHSASGTIFLEMNAKSFDKAVDLYEKIGRFSKELAQKIAVTTILMSAIAPSYADVKPNYNNRFEHRTEIIWKKDSSQKKPQTTSSTKHKISEELSKKTILPNQ